MAKNVPAFEVTCPCCNAVLKVDPQTKAVISHTAAVKPKMFEDIEAAARAMKEQDSRRDSIFRQSVEAQKHASDLLEKEIPGSSEESQRIARHRQADSRLGPGIVERHSSLNPLQYPHARLSSAFGPSWRPGSSFHPGE